MCAVLATTLGSVIVSTGRIADLGIQADVVKKLTFFVSFLLVFYVIVTVASPGDVDLLAKVLVGSGGVVALCALIEFRTDYNVFAHLNDVFPFLQEQGVDTARRPARWTAARAGLGPASDRSRAQC